MATKRTKIVIGKTDRLSLPEFELEDIPCKTDTGAYTSSLHCSKVHLLEKDDKTYLCFRLYDPKFGIKSRKEYRFQNFKEKRVRSSNGEVEERYSITTPVVIFGKKFETEFTLSFREKMRFPILLGRKFLNKRFIVDVSKTDLSYLQKQD